MIPLTENCHLPCSASPCMRLIPARDDEWDLYIRRTQHDCFHTRKYHQLWETLGVEAWLAVYGTQERFVAWPYLLRQIQGESGQTYRDITCVYGYGGPVAKDCHAGDPFLVEAWKAFLRVWNEQGVISVFTRFHPVLGNHAWLVSAGNDSMAGVCAQGHTVGIALEVPEEEIWNNYERKLRQKIRKCQRLGAITIQDREWEHLDEFIRLYYLTMERNCAAPFYFFSKAHFRRLQGALGQNGMLVLTTIAGRVAAAGIMMEYAGIGHLYLSGSDEAFAHVGPSKLLTHDSIMWARGNGGRYFHMGGGRGNRYDSLFAFKASFSPERLAFYTGRWVLDPPMYSRLTQEHQSRTSPGALLAANYFPAYRAPTINPPLPTIGDVQDPTAEVLGELVAGRNGCNNR
jgi:hypothetical protein